VDIQDLMFEGNGENLFDPTGVRRPALDRSWFRRLRAECGRIDGCRDMDTRLAVLLPCELEIISLQSFGPPILVIFDWNVLKSIVRAGHT